MKKTAKAATKNKSRPAGKVREAAESPTTKSASDVDLRTDERRIRVMQLWGKKSIQIAKILLEEGFDVNAGEKPLTKDKIEEWSKRRLDSMRRNVDNDKEHWRGEFKKKAQVPRTADDLAVEREEYVLSLQTDLDDIDDILVAKDTKSTAKGILIGEKRQTRVAIAKAKGIEQAGEFDPESQAKSNRATVLVLDLANCSEEYKQKVLSDAVGG